MTDKVQMTQGQYQRKTAYHIDPLMADSVEVVEPDFFPRHNGEQDASTIMKEIRKARALSRQKTKHRPRGMLLCLILLFAFVPFVGHSPAARASASTTINQGDKSLQVAAVQQRLRSFGYSVLVDGDFGPQTDRAVRHFQKSNGLDADGVVGPKTMKIMGLNLGANVSIQAPVVRSKPLQIVPASTGGVEQWHSLALKAGWTQSQWPNVACIIWRESNGKPWVQNRSGATGLMQIMKRYFPGVNLKDPFTNLRIGHQMFLSRGWRPWALPNSRCL